MSPLRKIGLLLLLIVAIFAVGTVGYMIVEGAAFLDALYMTAITLASVGYREVVPLGPGGQVFTIMLISLGVGTITFSIYTIGAIVVEGQVRKILGRRQVERQIRTLKDHYIICGFGRMGRVLAQQLDREKVPFVVVEKEEEKLQLLAAGDYLLVTGDATSEEALEAANIRQARGLVSAVSSDADNLFVTLTARGMNPELFILARSHDERSEGKLLLAGANRVVDPFRLGGLRLAHAILRPAVVEFVELATHRAHLELEMEEVRIGPRSVLLDQTLRDSHLRSRYGLMVVAIKRSDGTMVFAPAPDEVIRQGDTLITIGKQESQLKLEEAADA